MWKYKNRLVDKDYWLNINGQVKPHLIDSKLLKNKDNEGQAIATMLCAA